uniref:Uncharacterized protein n=1 Tax=Romanomermis culicivorax TaxID=13658 RepID=A0A915I8B6_ROMCU
AVNSLKSNLSLGGPPKLANPIPKPALKLNKKLKLSSLKNNLQALSKKYCRKLSNSIILNE